MGELPSGIGVARVATVLQRLIGIRTTNVNMESPKGLTSITWNEGISHFIFDNSEAGCPCHYEGYIY